MSRIRRWSGPQRGALVAALLALGATGRPAAAQPAPTPAENGPAAPGIPQDADRWTLQFEPSVWLLSPSGKVHLPGATGGADSDEVRVEDLNLDSPRPRPAGEIHLRANRLRFGFSGGGYSLGRRFVSDKAFTIGAVDVSPGDALDVSFQFSTFELTAGWRVCSLDFAKRSEHPSDAVQTNLDVYLIGGLRAYDVDLDVNEQGGGSSAAGEFFAEPILGVRTDLELAHDFTIDLQVSGGGYRDSDRSSASLDIVVGFTWRPQANVGVQIGWRQVAFALRDGHGSDRFEYNGRMAGIQGSVVFRF